MDHSEEEQRALIVKAAALCVSLVVYVIQKRRCRKRRRLEIPCSPLHERDEDTQEVTSQIKFSEAPATKSGGAKQSRNNEDAGDPIVDGIASALHDIANAIREAGPAHVNPDLLPQVLDLPGFKEDDLLSVYDYLVLHRAEANGFLSKKIDHRVIWVKRKLESGQFGSL